MSFYFRLYPSVPRGCVFFGCVAARARPRMPNEEVQPAQAPNPINLLRGLFGK